MDTSLLDKQFLKQLDYQQEKEIYIKIISLSNDELPREEIVGRTTGGSINIDGASAVRRSCSLSLIALTTDQMITDKYWSYNNKFKLKIGLKNTIDKNYSEIIWFNMGTYIITGFNLNKSLNNISISISGKDKMCRLNGEVSGNIMADTDFGSISEIYENGDTKITKLEIYEIIRNAVREYGQERDENIIVNDLDEYGYELWEYRGDKPMYLFIEINNSSIPSVINMTLDGNTKVIFTNGTETTLQDFEEKNGVFYLFNNLAGIKATPIKYHMDSDSDDISYYVAKVEYGETAGYHQTPLVYNTDLILNAGETVTSLLDKLKAMLGDFEYFYDLNGKFIFQKKKTYVQELFSPINGDIITPTMYASQYSYKFEDENLFTAISNSSNINNLKNDFSVWGTRKSVSGADLPIHVRYAIDKKPIRYFSISENTEYLASSYDWRELIYQMAKDSQAGHLKEKTGYEQYYTDLLGFWRQLYDPSGDSKEYYADTDGVYKYWNKKIHQNPNSLNFWFDFLDSNGELNNFSVNTYDPITETYKTNIGTRTKVVKDSAVKSIYYKETPEILFVLPKEEVANITAYTPIYIQPNMVELFSRSAQGKSAISKINELMVQHTTAVETISITSIPIYYLQPNTRIYIEGYGDYTLDKITYSLTYNGTMSISGNKIMKPFY